MKRLTFCSVPTAATPLSAPKQMIFAIALATLVPTLSPVSAIAKRELPYEELAQEFLKSKGKADAPRNETYPETLLHESFVHIPVGVFEIWAPADELSATRAAKNFRSLCAALCSAQSEWLAWLGEGAQGGGALQADFAIYLNWIEGWDHNRIKSALDGETLEMLELFPPSDEVRLAGEHISHALRQRKVLDSKAGAKSESIKFVLMPTRKGFVEFLAYSGKQFPNDQGVFWAPGAKDWAFFGLNDLKIIALQYASPSSGPDEYTPFYDMNTKSKTGMQEQVVQMGLNRLLAHQHGDALPNSLASGLAINLVTKLYGANHSRVDGDLRGKVKSSRSMFVRGGLSEGGILAPNSAESRWRENYGKKHYGPILKKVQAAGAREAKNEKIKKGKYNSFLLKSDNGKETYLTHAPLLGPSAGEPEMVPDKVYGDYLEFTRAYRCAFLHWLQFNGQKSKKKAAASFSSLLSRLSGDLNGPELAVIAEEIYGAPLSDSTASKKSLEGRFLKWVSKHKAQKSRR